MTEYKRRGNFFAQLANIVGLPSVSGHANFMRMRPNQPARMFCRSLRTLAAALIFGTALLSAAAAQDSVPFRNGIAMHGEPAMPVGFGAFDYVNPQAPRGGRVTYGEVGSFDSLNPFVVRGTAPQLISGLVIETLMARNYDEPFSLYGLLAETVAVPDDRSWVEFRLNPRARFSDGTPVTAKDVAFSFKLLRDHGQPKYGTYFSKVKKVEIKDPQTIRFDLTGSGDRELPLVLGLLPVLPEHATDVADFEKGGLTPLIGSGPYAVSHVDPGRAFTLKRRDDYWGDDLPSMRGQANFDEIRTDYYRDEDTLFAAFRKGLVDVLPETDPMRWMTAYDFPAVREGKVIKDSFASDAPKGMNAFVFNTRRPLFADSRVREALAMLFDFEWANKRLFYGAYARTGSYFEGSNLSALGKPASEAERKLLAPFPDAVRADVMAGTWHPMKTDGSGRDRAQLRAALDLLKQAGWTVQGNVLRNAKGEAFHFEILVRTSDEERLALNYAHNLERAGIQASVRLVDYVQFAMRMDGFDFDMAPYFWLNSLSPGNEQANYWGSVAAGQHGTRNYPGIRSKAADAMIAAILSARSRDDLVTAARALDRVLISGFYVVPLYHLPDQWIAHWSYIKPPKTTSLYGALPQTWWRESEH